MISLKEIKERDRQTSETELLRFFGHTYTPHHSLKDVSMIQYQFQIVGKESDGNYIIQLFSFMTGEPTQCKIMQTHELFGDDVKLYATHELWMSAYEKDCRRIDRLESVA